MSKTLIQINNKYYLAEVCIYYDGAWDYYIESDDIYIRCITDITDNMPLWAMFIGKGKDIIDMSHNDIFNRYKIWTPITNKDEENIFISI